MAHRTPIDVRFYELDPYNHVNHSVYIQYFEVGRIDLLRSIGYTLDGMMQNGLMILVTDIESRFSRPAEADDHLIVETEVIEFRRVTSRWRQRILRGEEVLVTQQLRAAMTDLAGRPVRFPAAMVDALGPFKAVE